jgi:MFS family permease
MGMGMMGVGFVTVAAVQRWQVADSSVALYTVALLVGQAVGNLLSGLLADRWGHKRSLEIGISAMAAAFFIAWQPPSPLWFFVVFFGIGFSIGSGIVSGMMIAMEFSAPEDRPTYIGLSNTVVGLGGGIAPFIGGWIATYSYPALFALSTLINLVSVILFHWYVVEPRYYAKFNQREFSAET